MGELALEARGLRKEFREKVAVKNLSLNVPKGEIFGFLGPNGAGKTTSMKMLLGLVRPSAGSGRLLGVRLGEPRGRAKVGYLPEHFAFHEWLSGAELLRFHAGLVGLRRHDLDAHVESLLLRVGLLQDAGRRLRHYSKGMKQRLGLAQALLGGPELVFLDEPTSGLDPLGRRLVRDIIRELKALGTTVFLNSHLLSEVEITSDRVAFLRDGEVVKETTLQSTVRPIEVVMRLERAPAEIVRGLLSFGSDVRADGTHVRMRMEGESLLPRMTLWLAEQGVGLYELKTARLSLEELFLEVIGDAPLTG